MDFLAELKRRRVFRAAAVYAVTAWVVIQVSDVVAPRLGLSDRTVQFIILLAIVGLLVVLGNAYILFGRPDSAAAILNRAADVWAPSLAFHRQRSSGP